MVFSLLFRMNKKEGKEKKRNFFFLFFFLFGPFLAKPVSHAGHVTVLQKASDRSAAPFLLFTQNLKIQNSPSFFSFLLGIKKHKNYKNCCKVVKFVLTGQVLVLKENCPLPACDIVMFFFCIPLSLDF